MSEIMELSEITSAEQSPSLREVLRERIGTEFKSLFAPKTEISEDSRNRLLKLLENEELTATDVLTAIDEVIGGSC